MNINERIASRRAVLSKELGETHEADRKRDAARRRQEADAFQVQQDIKRLVLAFAKWAKQSRIRPSKLDRPRHARNKRGWEVTSVVANDAETHNGQPNRKFLRLYVDGTAEWYDATGFGSLSGATVQAVENGIVEFVARSTSTVPWNG